MQERLAETLVAPVEKSRLCLLLAKVVGMTTVMTGTLLLQATEMFEKSVGHVR